MVDNYKVYDTLLSFLNESKGLMEERKLNQNFILHVITLHEYCLITTNQFVEICYLLGNN